MPHNDYSDPELRFPRLEVRVVKTDGDAFHVQVWKWIKPGMREPRPVINRKQAGSYADVTEVIRQLSEEHKIEIDPDDVEWPRDH